jgi:hypothetical protein
MAIRIARRFTGIRIPGSATFHYRQHAGLRGRAHDQFQAGTRFRKWLEYDQMIFRDLYQQMTLAEYLPPGTSPKEGLRQAYLQRLAILASKLLMPEIHTELDIIATLPDQTPLSTPERQIVRSLVFNHPFYRQGSVVERFAFHDHIRRLAKTSTVVRMIRQELSASLSSHWKETGRWKSPRRTAGTAYKIYRLYMSGFWQRRPAITQTGL